MQPFIGKNFLLSTETAAVLFHQYASAVPIVDYHCHISPQEIAEDRQFQNITEAWLGGDHYKWRLMRACGIGEEYITGGAADRDKFQKWVETLQKAIGNPLYHWSHLELQRYFGYHGILNTDTADEVWELCGRKLREPSMSARSLILKSNVRVVCTTDDPADTLKWHIGLSEDSAFPVQVLPAFRPEKVLHPEQTDFISYIERLSAVSGVIIRDFASLKHALTARMEFFNSVGCRISDQSLAYIPYHTYEPEEPELLLQKRLSGAFLSEEELQKYQTALLACLGQEYHRLGWVMQLHYGCRRNINTAMYQKVGADAGFDCMDNYTPSAQAARFLDFLACDGRLPKTVLYSLNSNDNAVLESIAGCFGEPGITGKVQHGAAWWFNDHRSGIAAHLHTLADTGLLSGFIGMLTDSRSFLSYPRHEYFRRILCDVIGKWIEDGEYAPDLAQAGRIVQDISYYNAMRYFGF